MWQWGLGTSVPGFVVSNLQRVDHLGALDAACVQQVCMLSKTITLKQTRRPQSTLVLRENRTTGSSQLGLSISLSMRIENKVAKTEIWRAKTFRNA